MRLEINRLHVLAGAVLGGGSFIISFSQGPSVNALPIDLTVASGGRVALAPRAFILRASLTLAPLLRAGRRRLGTLAIEVFAGDSAHILLEEDVCEGVILPWYIVLK